MTKEASYPMPEGFTNLKRVNFKFGRCSHPHILLGILRSFYSFYFMSLCVLHACAHLNVCAYIHISTCACGGQRSTLNVFLSWALLNFFETRALKRPGTHWLARLAGPQLSGILLSSFLLHWDYSNRDAHLGVGDLNLGLPAAFLN